MMDRRLAEGKVNLRKSCKRSPPKWPNFTTGPRPIPRSPLLEPSRSHPHQCGGELLPNGKICRVLAVRKGIFRKSGINPDSLWKPTFPCLRNASPTEESGIVMEIFTCSTSASWMKFLIFDCIEFNRRFRYGDVAADIAFLLMDLDFHGYSALLRRTGRRLSFPFQRLAPLSSAEFLQSLPGLCPRKGDQLSSG